ncbi:MAG: hypothetical protein WD042_16350 [Phycisphaeraceae bacterium]
MKRWSRRVLAVIVGLSLGWYAAGWMPAAIRAEAVTPHAERQAGGHGTAGGDAHATAPAKELVPQTEHAAWFGTLLIAIIGLFGAAVVLGIPAMKLRTPEAPEPMDTAPAHDAGGHEH